MKRDLLHSERGLSQKLFRVLDANIVDAVYKALAGIVYDTRLSFSFGERENACFDAWSTNKNANNILGSATTLTAEENTDASAIYSDILTYVATEVLKFINGSMDVNDDAVWNDYVSKIEAMGIDELTDIVQGAYDRANR